MVIHISFQEYGLKDFLFLKGKWLRIRSISISQLLRGVVTHLYVTLLGEDFCFLTSLAESCRKKMLYLCNMENYLISEAIGDIASKKIGR